MSRPSGARSCMRKKELDAIAKGIRSKCPVEALDELRVVLYFEAGSRQRLEETGQFRHEQRGMRLLRRAKSGLDAKVQLHSTALKPGAATGREIWRLGNFRQAKNDSVKLASQRFAARGHGELNVIDSVNGHVANSPID